ncbi:WD40 domain-containing protein [Encephalitozoon hellem]|uniref:WD40 domain-containing protein n=1 Tax=Encephalitozoon hellem TaxID=27973 RepID=A0ABY8CHZ5_ENCHE|nr:WD40 domain-containing protein [Encephalitozoon hellem]
MILTDEAFSEFKRSKPLGSGVSPEEVEYSTDGLMISSTQGNVLRLYSSISGSLQNIIHLPTIQKYKFMYPNTIVHSASNSLYLLSVFDNKYVSTFADHKSQINALSVCPREDTIMSSSYDSTNYWDIRKKNPIYRISAPNSISCLSSSNDYAMLINGTLLKIYDKRNIKGPKSTSSLPEKRYKEMFYSPDGSFIVVSGEKSHLFLSPDGSTRNALNLERGGSGCITPDSKFFLCCEGSSVLVYHPKTRRRLHAFKTPGLDNVKVRFNPFYAQFASSSTLLSIWGIKEHSEQQSS